MSEQTLMASMLRSTQEHLDATRNELYAAAINLCMICVSDADKIIECTNEECSLHKHRIVALNHLKDKDNE